MRIPLLVVVGLLAQHSGESAATHGVDTAEPTPEPIESATPIATPATESSPTPPPSPAPVATPQDRTEVHTWGEVHYANLDGPASDGRDARIDLPRVAILLTQRSGETVSLHTEIVFEHAERVGIDQAYVDWAPTRRIGVRSGMLLVPVGIANLRHEPTDYHGVARTTNDTWLVPATWRELGVALGGEAPYAVRWQLAFFNGINGSGFDGATGLRGGRSETADSVVKEGMAVLRIDHSPVPGVDLGFSYLEGGASREEIDGSLALRLVETDVRVSRAGASMRAQAVRGWIRGAGALDAYLAAGIAPIAPIGSGVEGFYVEAAYDVLDRAPPVGATLEAIPFVRYEHSTTQLDMPGGFDADGAFDRSSVVAGLTLRPIPNVALKADFEWRWADEGDPPDVGRLGLAYRF